MDLGNNYTQFVDDIENGEFDNFLSKKHRAKIQEQRLYIKKLRKQGYSLKDAIKKAQARALKSKTSLRQETQEKSGMPIRRTKSSATCREKAMSIRFGSKQAKIDWMQKCRSEQGDDDLLSKKPNFTKLFKVGDMKKRIAKLNEQKRKINEEIDNDVDKENMPNLEQVDTQIIEEAVSTQEAPKKSFVEKYKTLLMIGGGIVVALLVLRK